MAASSDNINHALEIERVSKSFGEFRAVDDVSIAVKRGEFLSLLGPSGCGKTTLLRMVAGFETPTSGEIRIAGARVNERPAYARPIGMVFQNLALFPHMTVGENVAYGLRVRSVAGGEIRQRVDQTLQLVGLQGFEGRHIHQLSGGQKQRVALARALVIRPEVLLLDEPLSALDLKLRRQLQQELKQIQRRVGTTFIFVTHDQEEALAMSDRIAVINGGKVEQLGDPQTVYAQPQTPFVARFVGDTNFLSAAVLSEAGGDAKIELSDFERSATVRAGYPVRPGDKVGASIRPEHVFIAAGKCARSPIEGTVVERSYVGANTRYVIRLSRGGGADDFIALVPNTQAGSEQFEPEQAVYLGWHDENIALVPLSGPAFTHQTTHAINGR